jgi:hypothetical protein
MWNYKMAYVCQETPFLSKLKHESSQLLHDNDTHNTVEVSISTDVKVSKLIWPNYYLIFSLAVQPSAGYGLLVLRCFLITYNDAPQSVGLLWTSDQLVAKTST